MSEHINPYEPPHSDPAAPQPVTGQRFDIVNLPTVDQYIRAMWLGSGPLYALRRIYLGRTIITAFAIYQAIKAYRLYQDGFDDLVNPSLLFAGCAGGFVVFSTLYFRHRVRRHFEQVYPLGDHVHYVAGDGMHTHGAAINAHVAWVGFQAFRSNADVILFYTHFPDRYSFIARSMLAEPGRWEELVALVAANVQRR